MRLDELIKDIENKLLNQKLTLSTKRREEAILRELYGKRQLLNLINDEMIKGE